MEMLVLLFVDLLVFIVWICISGFELQKADWGKMESGVISSNFSHLCL